MLSRLNMRASKQLLNASMQLNKRASMPLRFMSTDKIKFTFIEADGKEKQVTTPVGETILDIAHSNDIELEGACGGELACSTCHCVFEPSIFANLPEICEEEEDMLDLAWGLTDTSRLGCQIKVTKEMDGMIVKIPDESNNMI
ncbi:2Fe-2S ferredoxin [Thraustotheca clavata]|uniref:2Fe-2S ferredoxin n=1 Tax=Thraustotheca clavata TaxID=74557 RepID=A0A1W0A3N9_9STRA|nr:2Fe-2S ferredoxin [Thraustotheca clavata]